MAELFAPPLIQAQNWQEAQRKFNEVIQQMGRMLNQVYTGANIPNTRLVAGTKIDGVETGADVTEDHEAATIASQGDLATKDQVDTAEIVNDAVDKDKISVLGVDADGKLVLTQIGTSVTKLEDIVNDLGTQVAGIIQSGVTVNAGLRTVMDYTVSTNCTNFTLSSLTGDTDEEWNIHCLWKRNGTSAANFGIQPNADTGANYGFRTMYGAGASESTVLTYVNAAYTYLWTGRADTDHYYSQGYGKMNTKSGFIRQLMGLFSRDLTGATANGLYTMTDIWNNTADEITSMLFLCSVADGIHAGSRVFAYKRVA